MQSFVITNAKLGESGGEIGRIAREKVSVDAKEGAIDLKSCQ
jgi:hypothetical protein